MTYDIVSTGSKGNAVCINSAVLIDCGVTYKQIKDHEKDLKLVLLTHFHQDHFKASTIKKLAENRPTLRFGCASWLVPELAKIVNKKNIDVYRINHEYKYANVSVVPFELYHNVPNIGYKIHIDNERMFYATDTNSLSGISAKDYDLYLVEGNHTEAEITERIKSKQESGEYIYEYEAAKNHLSIESANNWLYANMKPTSEYVFLHRHE